MRLTQTGIPAGIKTLAIFVIVASLGAATGLLFSKTSVAMAQGKMSVLASQDAGQFNMRYGYPQDK